MDFEVILGGSGDWTARQVLGRFRNGRVEEYGTLTFVGNVPKRVANPKKVITR